MVVFVLEAVALILLAKLMFDVPFPEQPLSVAMGLLLGAVSFAALGVALTTFIRSAEGASAVISAVYLPMAFLAGSFWTTQAYPPVLEAIANLLPLTYFIHLMRDIVLRHEQIWENWTDVAVVAAWGLVGLVVTVPAVPLGASGGLEGLTAHGGAGRSQREARGRPRQLLRRGDRGVERVDEPVDVLLGETAAAGP